DGNLSYRERVSVVQVTRRAPQAERLNIATTWSLLTVARIVIAMSRHRLFLLSPAHCGGERAKLIYRPEARFELAVKLRTPQGAPIGEVFSFLSGLYFRGKLAYARRFSNPPADITGHLIITTNRGLLPADQFVTLKELQRMGCVPIDADDHRYRRPLRRSI